jgi:hypothetical protein
MILQFKAITYAVALNKLLNERDGVLIIYLVILLIDVHTV